MSHTHIVYDSVNLLKLNRTQESWATNVYNYYLWIQLWSFDSAKLRLIADNLNIFKNITLNLFTYFIDVITSR